MKPIIRCSSLDQLFECPGSFSLQQLVKSREGAESHEGSYLHWVIAARLIGELGAWPPEGGLPPPAVPAGYKAPTRSDWIADFCFDLVAREIIADWSLEVEPPLAFEFGRFILSGHLDALAVAHDGTASAGYDWKTGYHAVDPAASNNQCLGYIVLQKRAYPGLKSARFTVVQPRANEDDGEQRVSTVAVEGSSLDDAVAYLERRVNDALDHLDQLNTGPRQCRWCSAALQCPAIRAETQVMKMKLTPALLAHLKHEPDDAVLADLAVSAKVLAQPFEDAKALLHERLAICGSVTSADGVTITQAEEKGKWKVTNPGPLYANLCATLPSAEVAQVVTPAVTPLRDALARVLNIPKTGKAPVTAASVFAEKFAPHMEQGVKRVLKFN